MFIACVHPHVTSCFDCKIRHCGVGVHVGDKNISGCVSLVTQCLNVQFEYCNAILVTVFSHPEEEY